MSFLNPVSEPVLRFSSKDVGAPQINYASRSPGDIKTIFKACLNVGYGSKAGAGWTIALESGNIIEFSSPSTAMSDYKICLDDRAAASTTYYYKYKNVKKAMEYAAISRVNNSYTEFDAAAITNGWQLIVTKQGLYFVEIFTSVYLNKPVARLTYFGRVKSTLKAGDVGENIAFWNLGVYNSSNNYVYSFLDNAFYLAHYRLNIYSGLYFSGANIETFAGGVSRNISAVGVISQVFLRTGDRGMIGEHPGLLLNDSVDIDADIGIFERVIDGRNVLSVCATWLSNTDDEKNQARIFLIRLDNWDF